MPDQFGFEHLADWGNVYHRCVECEAYPFGVRVSERERERHHRRHVRERQRELEQKRAAALRLARRAKRAYERENV